MLPTNSCITRSREEILADACLRLEEDLRDIEPMEYYLFLMFGELPSVYERVNDIIGCHFTDGTMGFACTGEANIGWRENPLAAIDLEFSSHDIFVYFRLFIAGNQTGVEIHHIVFYESEGDPSENTEALKSALLAASKSTAKS